jgi:AraC-like DNA-binding protein
VPYAEIAPPPRLRSLVACYWAISRASGGHRVLPDGCIDVLLTADGGARLVGTMTRAIVAPPGERAVFGVRFRPGEAARIAPLAPAELTDGGAPLADAWGADARALECDALRALEDRALSADDVLARLAPLVDRALEERLARHARASDPAVRAAAGALASGSTVHEAARRANLSERQLARRFGARVGIGPKTFARVMRLQRATSAIWSGANAGEAAAIAGYADQAHFTRDAKDLAGVTPVRFVQDARVAAQ